MRLGICNYLDDSTITTTNENGSYPVENLRHKFLEKRYQALGQGATVTVLFPEDRKVSMIGFGYHNIIDSDNTYKLDKSATDTLILDKTATQTLILQPASFYKIKDSGGGVVASGEYQLTDGQTVVQYFDPITARSIEFTFSAPVGQVLYVGGLTICNYLELELFDLNPNYSLDPRTSQRVTDGGQSITKYRRALESWIASVSNLTNEKRKELNEAIRQTRKPVYVDLFPQSHDYQSPLYADITQWGEYSEDSTNQVFGSTIGIEERR